MRLLPKKNENKRKPKSLFQEKKQQLIESIEAEVSKLNQVKVLTKAETFKITEQSLKIIGELDTQWRQLEFEVEKLEQRKAEALKPLIDQEQDLEARINEFQIKHTQLTDDLVLYEFNKSEWERNSAEIIKQKQDMELESKQLKNSRITLGRQIRNFEKEMSERKKELKQQQFVLSLKESELKKGWEDIEADKKANLIVKQSLDDYKNNLDSQTKHIESQQQALKVAAQLLKKKYE